MKQGEMGSGLGGGLRHRMEGQDVLTEKVTSEERSEEGEVTV